MGTGDTNVDPDELEYIIPANDDAIRSIRFLCQLVADAANSARAAAARLREPEAREPKAAESEFDESAAADLVARLARRARLLRPDLEDDDVLPGVGGSAPPDPRSEPDRSVRRSVPSAQCPAHQPP